MSQETIDIPRQQIIRMCDQIGRNAKDFRCRSTLDKIISFLQCEGQIPSIFSKMSVSSQRELIGAIGFAEEICRMGIAAQQPHNNLEANLYCDMVCPPLVRFNLEDLHSTLKGLRDLRELLVTQKEVSNVSGIKDNPLFSRISSFQTDSDTLCDILIKNALTDDSKKSFLFAHMVLKADPSRLSNKLKENEVIREIFPVAIAHACTLIHMAIEARTAKDPQRRSEYKKYVSSQVPQLLEISTGKLRLLLTTIAIKLATISASFNE